MPLTRTCACDAKVGAEIVGVEYGVNVNVLGPLTVHGNVPKRPAAVKLASSHIELADVTLPNVYVYAIKAVLTD
jgi:hypothetical protein